jgi:uncharacterized protein YndB with AHSA1/START domain
MVTPSFGVSRTFDTSLERLWAAFTDDGELSRWYMPPAARVLASHMDLSVGGSYRYGLDMPGGAQMWGRWDIARVAAPELLTFTQYFTDASGRIARNPHDPDWPLRLKSEFRFAIQGGGATVTINLAPLDATEAEIAAFRKGFAILSQGWERVLNALDAHLAQHR